MHHTSTLHSSVQPNLVSTPRANFLFSAIAILVSFLKKLVAKRRNKKNTDSKDAVYNHLYNEPAYAKSFLVSGMVVHSEQRWLKQYTLERIEGKVVQFGNASHSVRPCHPELVYPEHSRREGSQLEPAATSSNNNTPNTNSFMKKLLRKSKFVSLLIVGLLLVSAAFTQVTYYSRGTNPNTLTNWNTNRAGGGSGSPLHAGDIFIVQGTGQPGGPYTMTTSGTWTVSGSNSRIEIESGAILNIANTTTLQRLTILSGGTVNITGSVPLTVNNGNAAGFDL